MAIPNRQIGWSQESNLLWEITKQMDKLTKVVSASAAPVESYKVYTALLTQSGGDEPDTAVDGALTIGRTYLIQNNDGSGDFTNVGAPNNNIGTYFVATGTTPNSWGNAGQVSLGLNYGAPVVTVLENTIGNIYWTYDATGQYLANLTGAFPDGKTYQVIGNSRDIGSINRTDWINTNSVLVQTLLYSFTPDDDLLDRTPIEIRVYN